MNENSACMYIYIFLCVYSYETYEMANKIKWNSMEVSLWVICMQKYFILQIKLLFVGKMKSVFLTSVQRILKYLYFTGK